MLGYCFDLTFHLVLLDGGIIFFILQQSFLQEGGECCERSDSAANVRCMCARILEPDRKCPVSPAGDLLDLT